MEVGGARERGARCHGALAHHGQRLGARRAHVPQVGAASVRREREVLRVRREERAGQQLDQHVAAALDVEPAPAELRHQLGDHPLRVVRVADEEEPGRAALGHPVDERRVGGEAGGEPLRHAVVPGREVGGEGAPRERGPELERVQRAKRFARAGDVLAGGPVRRPAAARRFEEGVDAREQGAGRRAAHHRRVVRRPNDTLRTRRHRQRALQQRGALRREAEPAPARARRAPACRRPPEHPAEVCAQLGRREGDRLGRALGHAEHARREPCEIGAHGRRTWRASESPT